MDSVFLELIDSLNKQINEVKYLLSIDNDLNGTNITVEDIIDIIKYGESDSYEFDINKDTLFITDGDPINTIKVLKCASINSNYKFTLFINEGFIGINEWLVSYFNDINKNGSLISLDTDMNYNKYIGNKNIDVIPLGEEALINQVDEDFMN